MVFTLTSPLTRAEIALGVIKKTGELGVELTLIPPLTLMGMEFQGVYGNCNSMVGENCNFAA